MKKYLVVIMAVLMALCLCACGKSEAVKAAEEKNSGNRRSNAG